MALTLTQINRIEQGRVQPDNISLFELIVLMSKKHAQYMLRLTKNTSGNADAESYKNKIDNLSKRVIQNDSSLYQNILSNLIIYAGNTLIYSEVKAFNDSDWEYMIETNMGIIFELLADVTTAEKTAWESISA